MKPSTHVAMLLPLLAAVGGCIIDDASGTRGQATAPSASVPDSGSPVRRESAAETLYDARESPPGEPEPTLDVEGRVNE